MVSSSFVGLGIRMNWFRIVEVVDTVMITTGWSSDSRTTKSWESKSFDGLNENVERSIRVVVSCN